MEFNKSIDKRKSIRGYKNEQISENALEDSLSVANEVPNSGPFQ